MKSRIFNLVISVAVLTVLTIPLGLAAQNDAAQAQKTQHHHYKLIDMGTFGGSSSCINEPSLSVPAVNARGRTVGTSATAALQTSSSNPTAINCGGGPNIFHGFEWRDGAVTDLGTLAGPDFNSDADSIDDRGVIEGVSENGLLDPAVGFNQVRAVIWKDGQIQDLGTLGGLDSWSFGINNSGQVVGMALNTVPDPVSMYSWVILGSSNSTQTRAFLWQHGNMQDLGTLGGQDAWAWAINEKGQVLGLSYTNSVPNAGTGFPTLDTFFWQNGKMHDMGSLGGVIGFPVALNQHGQAIGGSSTAANPTACWVPSFSSWEFGDANCHPFLWESGRLTDLNRSTPGAAPQTADAINDVGEIVGGATFATQIHDAYLRRDGAAIDLGHLDGDCDSEA